MKDYRYKGSTIAELEAGLTPLFDDEEASEELVRNWEYFVKLPIQGEDSFEICAYSSDGKGSITFSRKTPHQIFFKKYEIREGKEGWEVENPYEPIMVKDGDND